MERLVGLEAIDLDTEFPLALQESTLPNGRARFGTVEVLRRKVKTLSSFSHVRLAFETFEYQMAQMPYYDSMPRDKYLGIYTSMILYSPRSLDSAVLVFYRVRHNCDVLRGFILRVGGKKLCEEILRLEKFIH